jgi:hypothetical protein
MADVLGRYPLSTADGQAIPNDTIRPKALYKIALTTSATSELTLTTGYKTAVLYSDVDCYVKFGGTASVPSTTPVTDELFLPAGTIMTVSPEQMKISAVALTGTGSLFVTLVATWSALSLELQNTRR